MTESALLDRAGSTTPFNRRPAVLATRHRLDEPGAAETQCGPVLVDGDHSHAATEASWPRRWCPPPTPCRRSGIHRALDDDLRGRRARRFDDGAKPPAVRGCEFDAHVDVQPAVRNSGNNFAAVVPSSKSSVTVADPANGDVLAIRT